MPRSDGVSDGIEPHTTVLGIWSEDDRCRRGLYTTSCGSDCCYRSEVVTPNRSALASMAEPTSSIRALESPCTAAAGSECGTLCRKADRGLDLQERCTSSGPKSRNRGASFLDKGESDLHARTHPSNLGAITRPNPGFSSNCQTVTSRLVGCQCFASPGPHSCWKTSNVLLMAPSDVVATAGGTGPDGAGKNG